MLVVGLMSLSRQEAQSSRLTHRTFPLRSFRLVATSIINSARLFGHLPSRVKMFRVCLHQASALTQSQCCDDVGDTDLIEINGFGPESVANPIPERLHLFPLFSMTAELAA